MPEKEKLTFKQWVSLLKSEDNPFNKIFLQPKFIAILFLASVFVSVFNLEEGGAVIFAWVIMAALVLCEDIFATTTPFLFMCVFLTDCYDSYYTFIGYIWMAVPIVAAIIFHFVFYRKRIVVGETLLGLGAISVALLIGGVGFIEFEDYFSGSALYHVVFLGIGMIGAYLLLKPHLVAKRNIDPKEMLIRCFYLMGLLAATIVMIRHIAVALPFIEENPRFQANNNLSTFLMFALPCPFYMALKKKWWILHVASAVFMSAMLLTSGSRGGLIFGFVELIICLATYAVFDKRLRYFYIAAGAIAVTASTSYIIYEAILALINYGTSLDMEVEIMNFVLDDEPRMLTLQRLYDNFWDYPIFGHGLGYSGNADLYNPKKGAMHWYHMIIPQIVGSMGIVGVLAYGFNFAVRIKAIVIDTILSDDKALSLTLGISYIGIVLMSQVNPGLFCPLPYSLMAVMIFALLDGKIKRIDFKGVRS